jgi:HEPN domain-containing protein
VVLLDTAEAEFVEPRPMSADVAWAEASAYFEAAMGYVERRFRGYELEAKEGWDDAEWRRDAAFMMHQIAERLYHAVLMVFTLYVPKSHNLIFLRKRTDPFDPRLREVWPTETKFQKRSFELLRAAYVKARYSPHYRVSNEELEWMASRVRLLEQVVKDACAKRLLAIQAEAAGGLTVSS